ncbi:MAG: hypothetical protein ABIJ39_07025 [Chloroflexota bacterium]
MMNKSGKTIGHLFVILFDGEPYTSNTIIVPIDTYRSDKQDKTVILLTGDHEFITCPSFVNYSLSRITSLTHIGNLIKDGRAKPKTPMREEILIRIREGVRKSKRTRNEVLIAYSNHMDRELNRKP